MGDRLTLNCSATWWMRSGRSSGNCRYVSPVAASASTRSVTENLGTEDHHSYCETGSGDGQRGAEGVVRPRGIDADGVFGYGNSAGLKSVGFARWNYHDSVGFSADPE